jgi:predicted nucleic acid-binding protein
MQVLLDTGPWVALIDRSESRHVECLAWLRGYEGKIYSTEAVLTEVLYLLNFSTDAQQAGLDFVLSGAVVIVPSSLESLKSVGALMKKYKDAPMDFADATLVCLAQELSIRHIVTFDRKDFGIYSLKKGQTFIVLP